ncbi:Crp/Fnr family transcriptional regulator [Chitinophaga sp. GCM10012297]|uniref:Crp/Fnr family transcriptional regulator n=1 Tax=Chitinophaga chungangae TaxID=2821488 RepID=A0ABS3YAM4_9BACT|nr:Crp/Fnr family transcriptional regulator [Chitinophaga chungangae]MBO9151724.1 Crp/Fnr family transcriptional regulator [Chitinophaga chungangae]
MNETTMFGKILAQVEKHIRLSEEEKQCFTSLLKPRKLLRRQFLLQAGDVCRYETFIVSGCLRSYLTDNNGQEHVLHFAIENWWISDLGSFLHHTPSLINIEALEPVEALQIDLPSLERLYREVPAFERFFRILHQNAYLAQNERILQGISQTAMERYEAFLAKYPAIAARVPQKHLASYLGITPVFISQLRKKRMEN